MAELTKLDDWQAESLRVTLFLTKELPEQQSGLWHLLTGEVAEESTFQPRVGGLTEQGPLGSNFLVLQSVKGRVDLHLTPQTADDVDVLTLGPYSAQHEAFSKATGKLLDLAKDSVKRVALGAILRYPVASRWAGYQKLTQYVNGLSPDENTTDLLYQINRRRDIELGGSKYKINRLTKWSVAMHIRASLSPVERMSTLGLTTTAVTAPVFACRLELDISTAGDVESLPAEHVPRLLAMLDEQAREIARDGDVR